MKSQVRATKLNLSKSTLLAAALAVAGMASLPAKAHADTTCSALIGGKASTLQSNSGYFYDFEMTIHRDAVAHVLYVNGYLSWNGSWIHGYAEEAFSDRRVGENNQNFDIDATEQLEVWLSPSGRLYVYNQNYSFWIVSNVDMSCAGGVVSKYVPGLGQVTLTFRNLGYLG
jgi:hypothetical protein